MSKKPHGPDPIIDAALALAAERGWRGLALADIAQRAHMPLSELVENFSSKTAILAAYMRRVDQRMLDGGTDAEDGPRDRLFDIIMRRFDAMANDRRALGIILRQSADDPWALLCGGRRFVKSMALTLETAGISSSGLGGLLRIKGLSTVYLYAFKIFLDDDSADHARTMAALDKALHRAEDLAALLWRHRAPQSPPHHPQPLGGDIPD